MKTLYQISTLKCVSNLSENFAHTAVVPVSLAIVTLSVELILGLKLDLGNRVCAHATWLNVGTDRGTVAQIPFSFENETENTISIFDFRTKNYVAILKRILQFSMQFLQNSTYRSGIFSTGSESKNIPIMM